MYRIFYAVTVSFTWAVHTVAMTHAVVATRQEAEECVRKTMDECSEKDFAGTIDREYHTLRGENYTIHWDINEIALDIERLAKEAA